MIYSPSSFHAAYRLSKFKWIVDLNLMNKLAFVLNLVFPKRCDAPENKMFYYCSVWVFSIASVDKNDNKKMAKQFLSRIKYKVIQGPRSTKEKKSLLTLLFWEKTRQLKIVLIKKYQLQFKKLASFILVAMCVNLQY